MVFAAVLGCVQVLWWRLCTQPGAEPLPGAPIQASRLVSWPGCSGAPVVAPCATTAAACPLRLAAGPCTGDAAHEAAVVLQLVGRAGCMLLPHPVGLGACACHWPQLQSWAPSCCSVQRRPCGLSLCQCCMGPKTLHNLLIRHLACCLACQALCCAAACLAAAPGSQACEAALPSHPAEPCLLLPPLCGTWRRALVLRPVPRPAPLLPAPAAPPSPCSCRRQGHQGGGQF